MGRRKQNDRWEYIINNPSLNEWRTSFDIQRTEQQLREQTQAWIDNLRSSTIDSSLSATGTKSDLYLQHKWIEYEHDMHNLINFLSVIDKLLQEIEDTESGITTRWVQSSGKKTMKEAKAKLKQYKKQLKAKKKALLKQDRAEIFDSDISHVRDLWQQINKVRSNVWFWQWWEFSSTASFLYNSPENARTANRHQEQVAEFEQKLLAEVRQWAILSIFNWNTQNAINFLRKIAEWRYDQADYTFYINNASILNPCLQRCGINPPIAISNNPSASREWLSNSPRSIDYSNQNWWETFQQWWIAWCLDRVLSNFGNMSQWQRDTWKSLWVLSIVWAWIFWLYKFYTNKNMGFWAKAWITAGTIFGSQVLTWENPIAIFNKILTGGISFDALGEKFGNTISWLGGSNSPSSERVVPAMQSMMVFNQWTTVSDIQTMTQSFRDNNQNRRNFYQQTCDKFQNEYWSQSLEQFRARFSNDFDEEWRENRLSSFWITWNTNKNETVHELANNTNMNETILQNFIETNKLQITSDPVKKAELESYVRSKNERNEQIDVTELELHKNGWFIHQDNQLDEQNNNAEISSSSLKWCIERWLTKSFNTLENKCPFWLKWFLRKKLNSVKNGQSEQITQDIITHTFKTNGNFTTIDISDNNVKQIYNKCINRIKNESSGLIKSAVSSYDRYGLQSKFRDRWLQWKKDKFDDRKDNLTVIFNSIYGEIIPELETKGQNVQIVCHWQTFNTITDAVNSLHILHPYWV